MNDNAISSATSALSNAGPDGQDTSPERPVLTARAVLSDLDTLHIEPGVEPYAALIQVDDERGVTHVLRLSREVASAIHFGLDTILHTDPPEEGDADEAHDRALEDRLHRLANG